MVLTKPVRVMLGHNVGCFLCDYYLQVPLLAPARDKRSPETRAHGGTRTRGGVLSLPVLRPGVRQEEARATGSGPMGAGGRRRRRLIDDHTPPAPPRDGPRGRAHIGPGGVGCTPRSAEANNPPPTKRELLAGIWRRLGTQCSTVPWWGFCDGSDAPNINTLDNLPERAQAAAPWPMVTTRNSNS